MELSETEWNGHPLALPLQRMEDGGTMLGLQGEVVDPSPRGKSRTVFANGDGRGDDVGRRVGGDAKA